MVTCFRSPKENTNESPSSAPTPPNSTSAATATNPAAASASSKPSKQKSAAQRKSRYSLGTKITETDPDWDADKVVLGDPALNAKRIDEAVKVAAKADIVLLALGGNEQTSREAWAVNHPGDRTNLDLYGNQDDLVKAILATGKPTVVFLQHGAPTRSTTSPSTSPRFSTAGISARKAAPPSPTSSSATTIPAQNCRSRFRAASASFPTTTTKSHPANANTWTAARFRSSLSAGDSATPRLNIRTCTRRPIRSARKADHRHRRRNQHRLGSRRRNRAALHPRRNQLGHPPRERAPRIPPHLAQSRRNQNRAVHARPRRTLIPQSRHASRRRARHFHVDGGWKFRGRDNSKARGRERRA